MNRSEFWTHAFAAIRTHTVTPNEAAARGADEALALFDQRFRNERDGALEPSQRDHLLGMLAGYVEDPADSDYQRGYLAALLEVADNIDLGYSPMRDELRAQLHASRPETTLDAIDLYMLRDGVELLQPDDGQAQQLRESLLRMLDRALGGQHKLILRD